MVSDYAFLHTKQYDKDMQYVRILRQAQDERREILNFLPNRSP